MDRRDFLTISGVGLAGLLMPYSRTIAAQELVSGLDVAMKKAIADAALQAATEAGASYCDVRVGRYLQQFVVTREDKVQNVVNTESTGVGVRVIANGAWGFAATRTHSHVSTMRGPVSSTSKSSARTIRDGTAW